MLLALNFEKCLSVEVRTRVASPQYVNCLERTEYSFSSLSISFIILSWKHISWWVFQDNPPRFRKKKNEEGKSAGEK